MEMREILEEKEYEEAETGKVEETGVEHEMEETMPAKGFWQDDRGIGVIEIVLILVVLIALVLVFKNEITSIVTNAFAKISGDAGSIIK